MFCKIKNKVSTLANKKVGGKGNESNVAHTTDAAAKNVYDKWTDLDLPQEIRKGTQRKYVIITRQHPCQQRSRRSPLTTDGDHFSLDICQRLLVP